MRLGRVVLRGPNFSMRNCFQILTEDLRQTFLESLLGAKNDRLDAAFRRHHFVFNLYTHVAIIENHVTQNRKNDCLIDLRRRVLSLDIAPGADLDEARLCDRYGMSRTPLREVLQRLAGDGFVTLANNRGAKVASMNLPVLRTFFQTAPLIYSSIARLAAENRTTRQLDDLKAVQAQFRTATQDRPLLNHRFHEIIGEMAANPYLVASLNRMLIDHTRLSQTFYRPASPAEAVLVTKASDQHDAMIAAIEAGETDLVIDLTLQHWDLSRDRIERFVRPDPLPLNVTQMKDAHAV